MRDLYNSIQVECNENIIVVKYSCRKYGHLDENVIIINVIISMKIYDEIKKLR